MARVGDQRLQRAVIGQQHQSLAVKVKPTGGIHPRRLHKISQRGALIRLRETGHDLEGLVEKQQWHGAIVDQLDTKR
jgi:hypothetical protein